MLSKRMLDLQAAGSLFLFISVLFAHADISLTLPYKEAAVETVSGKAVFSGGDILGDPGAPQLPRQVVTFLLPPEADPASVGISIENLTCALLPGRFSIDPALPLFADGKPGWPEGVTIVDGKNPAIYSRDAFYPPVFFDKVSIGRLRDYNLLTVSLYPFAFNPVSGALKKLTGGVLKLSFTTRRAKSSMDAAGPSSPMPDKKLRDLIVNYDQAIPGYAIKQPLFKSAAAGPKYVIITTSSIVSGSAMLAAFIAQKKSRGFDVQTVVESEWGGGTGNSAADKLRAWLKSKYITLGIKYVLLIGNPHPVNGDVPMKMTIMEDGDADRNTPTDFYYAELSGDWDVNKNGKYGEPFGDLGKPGGCDQFAELPVGRIPVYGNVKKLDSILQKIINYQNADQTGISWRKSAFFANYPLFTEYVGYDIFEAIIKDFIKPDNWSYYRIYDQAYGLNPPPDAIGTTVTKVTDIWKSGRFGLVSWSTHGYQTSADHVMTTSQSRNLNDAYPSTVYMGSCHCGRPEDSLNLGFSVLRNGGISTIAAARESWTAKDPYGKTGDFTKMIYRYYQALIVDSLSSGDALVWVKTYLDATGFPFIGCWMNWCDFNLYGDPAVGIYAHAQNAAALTPLQQEGSVFVPRIVNSGKSAIIRNISGRATIASISGRKITGTEAVNGNSLDISKLPRGVYLLKTNGGQMKFIK